jgi:hypothetical protein
MKNSLWMIGEDLQKLMADYDAVVDDASLSDEEKNRRISDLFGVMSEMGYEFDQKAENVARYIKVLEATAEAARKESQRVSQYARDAENRAEKLGKYLIRNMQISGRQRVDGQLIKLSLADQQDELVIPLDEMVPVEFMKVSYDPKKNEIKKYIKELPEGETCDWAELRPSQEKSLRIK